MLHNIYSALKTKELYPFRILQRYESNKFSSKKTYIKQLYKFMSKLNSYSILRQFYKMLNHSKKQQSSFSRREKNDKNAEAESSCGDKEANFFVCVPWNFYSITAVKTLPFLCIVMCFLLEDFSLILLELLLFLECLQYCPHCQFPKAVN